MTTEQLILQELKKLTQKVDSLEKELNDLKSKFCSVPSYPFGRPHFDGPNPHNSFVKPLPLAPYKPKGGDPWSGNGKPKIEPKLIDGHEELLTPFEIRESESTKELREIIREYRERQEKLCQYWKETPDKAPRYGEFNQELFDKVWEDYKKNPPKIIPADKSD